MPPVRAPCSRRAASGLGLASTAAAGCPAAISSAWFGPVRAAHAVRVVAGALGEHVEQQPAAGRVEPLRQRERHRAGSRRIDAATVATSREGTASTTRSAPGALARQVERDGRDERLERHVRQVAGVRAAARHGARRVGVAARRASTTWPRRASTHANAVPHEPPPTTSARTVSARDDVDDHGTPCSAERARAGGSRGSRRSRA